MSTIEKDTTRQTSPVVDDGADDIQVVEVASPTFNSPTADVVLRSNNHVCFRVHRVMLVEASGGFKEPILRHELGKSGQDVPIDILVSSAILDTILRFIYPVPDPSVTNLTQWQELYECAKNYDIPIVLASLRRQFIAADFIIISPLRAYAVAAIFDLKEEMDVAARRTFSQDLMRMNQLDEFKAMPASAFVSLLQLHRARTDLLRAWASKLVPAVPNCPSCRLVHWTQKYIDLIRAACIGDKVDLPALFKPSVLVNALQQWESASASSCKSCPPPMMKGVDEWFENLIKDVTTKVNKLSVSAIPEAF